MKRLLEPDVIVSCLVGIGFGLILSPYHPLAAAVGGGLLLCMGCFVCYNFLMFIDSNE